MNARVVLVACVGPHTTPWMRVRGRDVRLRITGMADGELVIAEDSTSTYKFDSAGEFPLLHSGPSVRFTKQGGQSPTTVEVISDG